MAEDGVSDGVSDGRFGLESMSETTRPSRPGAEEGFGQGKKHRRCVILSNLL